MSRQDDELRERQTIGAGDVGDVGDVLGAVPPAPSGEAAPPAAASAAAKGPNLFTIRRVEGASRVTAVTIPTVARSTVHAFDEREDRFNVDLATATAAVASGGFEIAEESKARLRGPGAGETPNDAAAREALARALDAAAESAAADAAAPAVTTEGEVSHE